MTTIVKSEVSPQYVTQQAQVIESVVIGGDLEQLKPEQRVAYYKQVCDSLGLNPLTKPFSYIKLNGKLTLYANRDAADQLRKRDRVSVTIVDRAVVDGVYVVTARAALSDGRSDESTGAVFIDKLVGEARANAMMKAETKAKRRVTLSICGLGWLDETEVDTIPDAKPFDPAVMELKPRDDEQPKPHWVDDPQKRAAFWGKLAEYGLGEKDVHAAGVAHVHEWTGTGAELITHVREYVAKNAEEVPA